MGNDDFSLKVMAIEESKSVGLARVVHSLRSQGKSIIGLNVGEPDIPPHKSIIEATKDSLNLGETKYSLVPGITELRQEIAESMSQKMQRDILPSQVLVGSGSKNLIYSTLQVLVNPGDEVIIHAPYWVTFPESIKLAGGVPVIVETDHDHQLHLEDIKKAVTEKTKLLILNNPNNPSGAVFPRDTIEEIMDFCIEKNIKVLSDEAYESLVFDDCEFVHPASLSNQSFELTISILTFSKSFCMTGFRVGFLIASEDLISYLNKFQSHMLGNVSVFSQRGAIAALKNQKEIVPALVSEFQKRKDIAYQEFSKTFKDMPQGQGGFYLFPHIQSFLNEEIKNDRELATYILEKTQVALLPGSAFGSPGHLRISYTTGVEEIREAARRINEALS